MAEFQSIYTPYLREYYSKKLYEYRAVASISTLNKQPDLKGIMRTRVADGQPIPIVYGLARVGGMVFAMDYTNGVWTVGYIACLGEINSIDHVYINGDEVTDGVEVNHLNKYTGTTTQTADTLLSTAIAGYSDDMVISDPAGDIGIAYIVLEWTDEQFDSWPDVVIELKGMKVYDPLSETVAYSQNSALHLGDYLSNDIYGVGKTVDSASLLSTKNYCYDTSPGESRRFSYCVMSNPLDSGEWVEILRTYASCFVVYRGDTVYLVPDKAGSSVMTITADDIERDSIEIIKKDSSDVPTVVRAYYTDTTGSEWREILCNPAKAAGVDAGTTQWRESRIRLTGVNRHSQAYRECVERLNKLALADLEVSWVQFDGAMEREIGDIVTLSHPYGLTSKTLRLIEEPRLVSPGRWAMRGLEYSAAAYSDVVVSGPTISDTNLPAHTTPAQVTGVSASEEVYQLANAEYASRIRVTWTASSSSYVTGYIIRIKQSTTLIATIEESGTEAASGPLKEGAYTVEVYAKTPLYVGTAGTDSVTLNGYTTAPSAPTGLSGSNNDSTVYLYWTASTSDNVRRYEVRYYTTAQTWNDGTKIESVNGLNLTTRGVVADGTWRFGVKAINRVGTYSNTADEVDIVVAAAPAGTEPITTYYQDTQPTGTIVTGSLWVNTSTAGKNEMKRYNGSTWDSLRDLTIAEASQLAADAIQDAADAAAIANGKITTFYDANEPVSGMSAGDLWVELDTGAPIDISTTFPAWQSSLSIQYAIILNESVSDSGTAGDAPSYSGTYAAAAIPNRATGKGINQVYNGWGTTALDSAGADHSIAMAISLPATITDGEYALYTNGATSAGQGVYVKAVSNVYTLKVGHNSGGSPEFGLFSINLSAGVHTIGVSWVDDTTDYISVYVDGALSSSQNLTYGLVVGGGDPEIGGYNVQADGSDAPADIDGSGIVITDFMAQNTTGTDWIDNGVFVDFHDYLFTGSGDTQKIHRYSGSAWVALTDPGISTALTNAQTAQTTADGKIESFFATSAPSASGVGDLWFDTSDPADYVIYRATAAGTGSWTSILTSSGIATAQATADGKNTIYRANGPTGPAGADEGDLWFELDNDNKPYRYESSVWQPVQDGAITTAQETADNALILVINSVRNNSFPASTNRRYIIDTDTNGSITMTLPSGPDMGNSVHFFDATGTFDVAPLTITSTDKNILGLAEDLIVDIRYFSGGMQYINSTIGWTLI